MKKGYIKGNLHTHCKYGHELVEGNIIYRTRNRGHGLEISRICKICHSNRNKKYKIDL